MSPGELLTLEVGAVAAGGVCVARHEERVVFVRHALPGEQVRAVVTEDAGRYLRADAVDVLAPSPDRVVPPCPYAGPGRCGGCDWQHAALPAQRAFKAAVVAEQLRRGAGVEREVVVEPVPVPGHPDDGLAWRSRVQFAVDAAGGLGLRRHRSHEIQTVERCLIATAGVESVGAEQHRWDAAQVEVIAGSSEPGDRAVVVTPRGRRAPRLPDVAEDVSLLLSDAKGYTTSVRGRPGVREVVGEHTFWVGGSGFWQVHPAAAAVLSGAVLEALDPQPGERALDLYAGVGVFTAALAARVAPRGEVTAVESWPPAVADARQNVRSLAGVRVEEGRAAETLSRLGLGRVDVVVLDPPREGANERVLALLAGLAPRRICYVACEPASLARDAATLHGHGYAVTGLRAFDLFPMTAHVECVALLEPGT